jgi:hypothetical protein
MPPNRPYDERGAKNGAPAPKPGHCAASRYGNSGGSSTLGDCSGRSPRGVVCGVGRLGGQLVHGGQRVDVGGDRVAAAAGGDDVPLSAAEFARPRRSTAATTIVAPPERHGVACGAPARRQAVPEADRSKEERLQAWTPGARGTKTAPRRTPLKQSAVGRVLPPRHRGRPTGCGCLRESRRRRAWRWLARGVEPEVMGAGVDLRWHCDPAFVAWLGPRPGGAGAARLDSVESWRLRSCARWRRSGPWGPAAPRTRPSRPRRAT